MQDRSHGLPPDDAVAEAAHVEMAIMQMPTPAFCMLDPDFRDWAPIIVSALLLCRTFYERLKEVREYHRRHFSAEVTEVSHNTPILGCLCFLSAFLVDF